MHNATRSSRSIRCVAGAVLALTGACASAATPTREVQTRYAQERARCMSGESGQAQETCLKEAANARDAAKKDQLSSGDGKLHQNKRERCDVLTGDEQRDCMTRARGNSVSGASVTTPEGSASIVKSNSTSGSVKGGGTITETITRETVVGAPVPASAASR